MPLKTSKPFLLTALLLALLIPLLHGCNKTDGESPSLASAEKSLSKESVDDAWREVLIATPEIVPDFYLRDHNNSPFTLEQLKHKWSFLVFGYTNCPDVCPTTLAEMDDFIQLLAERRKTDATTPDNPQVVFVSVDPKRDTAKELKKYLGYFNANFIGLVGNVEEIKKFCEPVGISFRYEQFTPELYGVEHSSAVVLIDPSARYYARFPAPINADDLAGIFQQITHSNTAVKNSS